MCICYVRLYLLRFAPARRSFSSAGKVDKKLTVASSFYAILRLCMYVFIEVLLGLLGLLGLTTNLTEIEFMLQSLCCQSLSSVF
jgi:hypothetical protein